MNNDGSNMNMNMNMDGFGGFGDMGSSGSIQESSSVTESSSSSWGGSSSSSISSSSSSNWGGNSSMGGSASINSSSSGSVNESINVNAGAGGASSSISMDISGSGYGPGNMPPKPTHTAKPNNGGWGVPCNQYCRQNCWENFKDDTDIYKQARINNCMIYSCACDLSLFDFGGGASAGPGGASASVTGPNGEKISANANAGGWGSGGSSSWNSGSSSSWNDNSSSSWNSGSSSSWNDNSSWNTGGSTSINSNTSINGGSAGGSIHMNSNIDDSTGGIHSSINMDGGSISANAGGASASIDMSGFPTGNGNWTYNETHSGNWNADQRGRSAFGSGIDFQADIEGTIKIDWADVERATAGYNISGGENYQWSQSGSASMPNMSINSNINENGDGVSAGVSIGGQKIEAHAGAGASGASSSVDIKGFPGATGSWNYSESHSWNATAGNNGRVFTDDGIDFAATVSGSVSAGEAAAIAGGWNSQYNSSESWNYSGNENVNIHGGASAGAASSSGSIDMNGQTIKTDVKVNPDGSVSGGIDMGDGQKMDVSAGPNGSHASSNFGGNTNANANPWGGFLLVQLEGEEETTITPLAMFLAACVVLATLLGAYVILREPKRDNFKKASKTEQRNAYSEKLNFLES